MLRGKDCTFSPQTRTCLSQWSAAPTGPFLRDGTHAQSCPLSLSKEDQTLAAPDRGLVLFLQPDLILSKRLPHILKKQMDSHVKIPKRTLIAVVLFLQKNRGSYNFLAQFFSKSTIVSAIAGSAQHLVVESFLYGRPCVWCWG